jgi:hypothetical protein
VPNTASKALPADAGPAHRTTVAKTTKAVRNDTRKRVS